MKCKNCGELIIKLEDDWYHLYTRKWYCNTKYAEPQTSDSKKES